MTMVILSALFERFSVSRIQDFSYAFWLLCCPLSLSVLLLVVAAWQQGLRLSPGPLCRAVRALVFLDLFPPFNCLFLLPSFSFPLPFPFFFFNLFPSSPFPSSHPLPFGFFSFPPPFSPSPLSLVSILSSILLCFLSFLLWWFSIVPSFSECHSPGILLSSCGPLFLQESGRCWTLCLGYLPTNFLKLSNILSVFHQSSLLWVSLFFCSPCTFSLWVWTVFFHFFMLCGTGPTFLPPCLWNLCLFRPCSRCWPSCLVRFIFPETLALSEVFVS